MKKRVLVVPAGTEIAHEVIESLRFSKYWDVYGGNSVKDHSEILLNDKCHFVPFVVDPNFVSAVQELVTKLDIDFVIPAHDEALFRLAGRIDGAIVAGPSPELGEILKLKSSTIAKLRGVVPAPQIYAPGEEKFPVFCKPDRGQGSRGIRIVHDSDELDQIRATDSNLIVQELLTGEEVTVDCFSDPSSRVLFASARSRVRTTGGISVRSRQVGDAEFPHLASKISEALHLTGAWFFQMKKNADGHYKLLEVANRIAGSSGFQRVRGVNFMDAWLHQLSGQDVKFQTLSKFDFVYDRALYVKTIVQSRINALYVDFDDTLIIDGSIVNHRLIGILFGAKYNKRKKIVLLTRHDGIVEEKLVHFGLSSLFDEIIHLKKGEMKSNSVEGADAIFIDDSYRERADVAEKCGAIAIGPESLDLVEGIL
ncbi:ATP-grasp domain-containing protein [Methylobacterium sp. E-066]|uniref:ATP-grasp domain-containing protein n=1 Tax=Methylobacterium sp. E-066 TaxID=2836584 RepID=UPI001FBB08AA|nr:ATP-grasp domain-containing protein [Methylobacterium sp. E-066]MCJ2142964.1 ATP-grasp domain-containing protein [Methylobacterium sp. E-066]